MRRSAATALVAVLLLLPMGARAQTSAAAPVRVGEAVVLTLSAERDGKAASERAKAATAALALVVSDPEVREVRVVRAESGLVVHVGDTPILELTAEDAARAGEASLDAYGSKTASTLRTALASERKRSRIAETVFSFSLVVFFALVAFYLINDPKNRLWTEVGYDFLFDQRRVRECACRTAVRAIARAEDGGVHRRQRRFHRRCRRCTRECSARPHAPRSGSPSHVDTRGLRSQPRS